MTAPRFDVYSLVHKGQRKKLFELTIAAGQLDAEDSARRETLAKDIERTVAAIVDHTEAEEKFFGPLYEQAAPAIGHHLAAQHGHLARELEDLHSAVSKALAHPSTSNDLALHRALSRFSASYLAHIDAEEASLPELWARFDDATLARTQGALVASHPPASVRFNLCNMLPATCAAERVAFLTNLRRNMPPAAFAGVRELVSGLVPASDWAAVDAP